jgi:hypothetical protein
MARLFRVLWRAPSVWSRAILARTDSRRPSIAAAAAQELHGGLQAADLGEYEQFDKAGKGALLRREGLYTSLISEWRKQRDEGAGRVAAAAWPPSGRLA